MLVSGLTSHTAGTLARAADVNGNNAIIQNVLNGNIQEDNFGTMAGVLTWAIITNVLTQNISTSSTAGAITVTSTGVLAAAKSILRLTSGAAQTTGDALAYFDLSSGSSSIPVLKLANAGTGVALDITQTGAAYGLQVTKATSGYAQNLAVSAGAGGLRIGATGSGSGVAAVQSGADTGVAFEASNSGTLATNKPAIWANASGANTASGAALIEADATNASSTIPLYKAKNAGTGAFLDFQDNASGGLAKLASTGVFTFVGSQSAGWISNLGLASATTTDPSDSVKITGATAALSASNPGFVAIPSTTAGLLTVFKFTADVTLKLTGCVFGLTADMADVQLQVYAINNNGSLVWGVGLTGRRTLTDTSTDTAQAGITSRTSVLVNSALSAGTWPVARVGWANADHTSAGAAWAVQGSAGDLNVNAAVPDITEWATYTPALSNNTNVNSNTARYRRVGDTLEVAGVLGWNGAGGGGDFLIGLPSGLVIDTAKLPSTTLYNVGPAHWATSAGGGAVTFCVYNSTTTLAVLTALMTGILQGTSFANGGYIRYRFSVPIIGWATN